MEERSLYGHLYIEDKLMMTFVHRLAALFCTADAIHFARKAAPKQGAWDLTVTMYWIKQMGGSQLLQSIWVTSPEIPTISLVTSVSAGQGSAVWTGSSQPSLKFIRQIDFICLLQFPENHLQDKIHLSLQDSWYPWAPASFIS